MNKDFAHYYQQIRSKQKRETLIWSLGLVVLYLGAGNIAEFNLHTVWLSIPHFFDYLAETIPTLHWRYCLPMATPKGHSPTGVTG